jgi:sugar phosphate isomerase/epimerase
MQVRQGFTVEGDADPEAAFAFAADRGFAFVELNMDYAFERSRVDPGAVRDLADEYGLDLVVHLPYRPDPGSPHAHDREGACRTLEAAVDVAAEMGAERGVMHATSRAHPAKWDHDRVREWIFESVQRVHEYGRERGVAVVAENLKSPFLDAGDLPLLVEQTDAAVCLDTGHALATGQDGADQADLLRAYGDRIAHLHLNESRRTDGDDEHLPVGLGVVDFGAVADAVRETGWTGTATHETFGFDREFVALGKERFDGLLAPGYS